MIYVIIMVAIMLSIVLFLINSHKRQILEIKRQSNEQSRIEIAKAKEKFLKESALLKYEYDMKNKEKTIELEALRKKVKILKKNQYDPRKDPKGLRRPKAFKT